MTTKNYDIKIEQQVEQNWGSITGARINIGLGEVTAPDRAAITAYLRHLIIAGKALRIYDRDAAVELSPSHRAALQRLWNEPFYVRRLGQTEASRRSLTEAIQERLAAQRPAGIVRRAVTLLAEAGVGKTPALQYTLLYLAEQSLPYFESNAPLPETAIPALVPLLVRLGELRPNQLLLPLVRAAFNRFATEAISLDQTALLLKEYDCLIMLDDLDKIAFSSQGGGIKLIREFMDNYPNQRYLISCRLNSYHEQLGPMEAFVLEELTETQVHTVLATEFDERLLPLACNRAMLQILIREGQPAERRWSRGRLLQRMVWAQLRLREEEVDLELEMLEALLERLAYQMHQTRLYRIEEQALMAFITEHLAAWHEPYTWRQVTHRLRETGIMLPDERRFWRFHNRSTQAYFVAAAIVHEPAHLTSLMAGAADFWWREPLEILVGLLDEPSEFIFELIDRDALVAAHCIQFTGQPIEQRVVNALIDTLVEQMRYERAAGREQLLRLLNQTGYLPPQELLWQLLMRERKSLVLLTLGQVLADARPRRQIYNFSPIPELEAGRIDPGLLAVINLWQEHLLTDLEDVRTAIEAELIATLQAPQRLPERVRGLAAIALGCIGADPSRTNAREVLLAELQRRGLNRFVGWCVTDALSQIRQAEVEQAALDLYRRSKRQASQAGRQRCVYAIYLLGTVGGRFAETAQVLYEALDSPEIDRRGYAAQAIGRLGLLEARERLEERLESRVLAAREQNPWVLRRVVEALGKVGTLESIHVLEPYLRHEQRRTRQRVREAMAGIRHRYEVV